jgi:hypothetical protein
MTLIWGAIGPRRFFADNYRALLYFPILGALLGLPVYYFRRTYPTSQLWKKIHIPLFLGGLNYLPPATGMNYGSWVVVGLFFGWAVRRAHAAWWGKYNFALSAALDTSVGVAGMVIFFAVYFSGASKGFSWWGTEVYKVSYVFFLFLPPFPTGTLKTCGADASRIRVTGRDVRTLRYRKVGNLGYNAVSRCRTGWMGVGVWKLKRTKQSEQGHYVARIPETDIYEDKNFHILYSFVEQWPCTLRNPNESCVKIFQLVFEMVEHAPDVQVLEGSCGKRTILH